MLREKAKLALLLGLLLFCCSTILTSHKSFRMGPRDLPVLQPQVNRFCKSIIKSSSKCRDRSKTRSVGLSYCQDIQRQASHCEAAVKQAYQHINMGGCPHELQDVTLCELERCGGYHGMSVMNNHIAGNNFMDADGCIQHCDAVRKVLETCVRDNVQHYLKKYGIQSR